MTAPSVPDVGDRRGAQAQAPLHAAGGGHLPGRRPHRGAGRERPGALATSSGTRRPPGSSACTTRWAAGCRARRSSRSASCRTSPPPSSSSWSAASSPTHRQDAEGRGGPEEAHAVDPVPHGLHRARRRPTPSPCSPSRSRARCRTPASRPALIMVVDPDRGRGVRHVAGRADHRARHRQRDEPAHHVLDPRAALARAAPAGPVRQGRRGRARSRRCFYVAVLVGIIAAVVAMTIAARRIPIQIPRKVMGRGRIREGQKTFIPIRLHHRRRDADHLRPDHHHRAGHDRQLHQEPAPDATSPASSARAACPTTSCSRR